MLLDSRLQCPLIRSDNLTNLLTVLKQQKCWHSPDTEFLRDITDFIDVDFVKFCVGEFLGELCDFWGDNFAGSAPSGETVEDD